MFPIWIGVPCEAEQTAGPSGHQEGPFNEYPQGDTISGKKNPFITFIENICPKLMIT